MNRDDWTVETAFAQLDSGGYRCEGGPLENNVAYRWLRAEIAELEKDYDDAIKTVEATIRVDVGRERARADAAESTVAELRAENEQLDRHMQKGMAVLSDEIHRRIEAEATIAKLQAELEGAREVHQRMRADVEKLDAAEARAEATEAALARLRSRFYAETGEWISDRVWESTPPATARSCPACGQSAPGWSPAE